MPHVMKVIRSEINRGKGTEESVMRLVTQFHDLDGNFLAEYDQWRPEETDAEIMERRKKHAQAI